MLAWFYGLSNVKTDDRLPARYSQHWIGKPNTYIAYLLTEIAGRRIWNANIDLSLAIHPEGTKH